MPTAVTAGAVLTLFGSALLLWCAVELRLRHHLRRHGVPTTARVVGDGDRRLDPYGDPYGELDSAPLITYTATTGPGAGLREAALTEAGPQEPGPRELRAVPPGERAEGRTVLTRPRGHTPLRRPGRLVPGAIVQVAYDPRRPSRVVLAGADQLRTLPSDIFWTVLGTAAVAGGLSLLATVLAH
ncbi:DUF3592 domain-containing protein [Kitasatospora sp. HUAS MG31]|uniref:DUF3592 domain-containing protein n=2 Tax=Kitasatospora camelliae TaxID=3156397 RepID=A0AAU8K5K7_9ACTN